MINYWIQNGLVSLGMLFRWWLLEVVTMAGLSVAGIYYYWLLTDLLRWRPLVIAGVAIFLIRLANMSATSD